MPSAALLLRLLIDEMRARMAAEAEAEVLREEIHKLKHRVIYIDKRPPWERKEEK